MVTREFGTLLIPFRASFCGVSIEPSQNHEQAVKWIMSCANVDGYYYPPIVQTYGVDPKTNRRKRIKNTERPAAVYFLPPSHTLNIESPVADDINFEDAGLIINLLAFLFQTRLQFSEWRFDGRVPIKANNSIGFFSEGTEAHF